MAKHIWSEEYHVGALSGNRFCLACKVWKSVENQDADCPVDEQLQRFLKYYRDDLLKTADYLENLARTYSVGDSDGVAAHLLAKTKRQAIEQLPLILALFLQEDEVAQKREKP